MNVLDVPFDVVLVGEHFRTALVATSKIVQPSYDEKNLSIILLFIIQLNITQLN